jgi:hypothetical protein
MMSVALIFSAFALRQEHGKLKSERTPVLYFKVRQQRKGVEDVVGIYHAVRRVYCSLINSSLIVGRASC